MASVCHHFEARHRPEPKNNSRTKCSNLPEFTSSLTFNHVSWSQKEYYTIKMIPVVLKKAEASKKVQGELGIPTGGYVNSVYQWIPGSSDITALDSSPSRLGIWHPVQP